MAGTVTVTRTKFYGPNQKVIIEKINLACVGDAANGSFPATTVNMFGKLVHVITNPGATAPTANYDIALGHPDDTSADLLGGALANRSATVTELVYPTVSSLPVWVAGDTSFAITNNIVNSATIDVNFYLLQSATE